MQPVLYIDAAEEYRDSLKLHLDSHYRIITCADGFEAFSVIKKERPSALITELYLPGYNGFRLLAGLKQIPNPPPVIILSRYTDPILIVRALREGARDFISKPCNFSYLKRRLHSLIHGITERQFHYTLPSVKPSGEPYIVGSSEIMKNIREEIRIFSASPMPVLLLGESGTGKELIAQAVHRLSARSEGPFETRNIAAIPEGLVASELFGCEAGAFTDARPRTGCFIDSDEGTLFLDEVGDSSPAVQKALLRVVEDGIVRPLGSSRVHRVNCRLICATNKNLDSLITEGKFRADLRYRIEGLTIRIPPLREHREDIPELVYHFLSSAGNTQDSLQKISDGAMDALISHSWPGNIRQLKVCVERAAVLARGRVITAEHIRF